MFAIIADGDSQVRLLVRGQGIADAGDGFDELIPADLFAQIPAVLEGKVTQWATGSKGNPTRKEVGSEGEEAREEDGFDGALRPRWDVGQPAFASGGTHGNQHWVRFCDVIEAALIEPEYQHRNQVHEGDHAIAPIAKVGIQANEPYRSGEEIGAGPELADQKSICAAFADVAGVNVLEEGVGDEVVSNEPEDVRRKDDESDCDAGPEPLRREVPACGRKRHADENSGNVKDDGVFGEQREAESRTDGEPPTGIFCFKQANGEPGHERPPQKCERGVLKLCCLEDGKRRECDRKRGGDLRKAAAPEVTRHQTADDNHDGLANDGKHAQADHGEPEEAEADALDEWREWRVRHKAPIEMPSIRQELQLVAMKSVPAIGQDV